jgi:hypothetical protein
MAVAANMVGTAKKKENSAAALRVSFLRHTPYNSSSGTRCTGYHGQALEQSRSLKAVK